MSDFAKVDTHHPFVGLGNTICKHPRHYCCLHNVWLSESDAKKKECRTCNRDNPGEPCPCFRENHYNKNINKLLRKSRPTNDKKKMKYYTT